MILWAVRAQRIYQAIDQGIKEAMEGGFGWLRDGRCEGHFYDGSYHDVDSNEMAFKDRRLDGIQRGRAQASPVLLNRVMAWKWLHRKIMRGVIMGDLSSRRGRIEGWSTAPASQVIKAIVPLARC